MASTVNKCTTRYFPPNHAQLSTGVKAADRNHRIRVKRKPFWLVQFAYGVMVLFILLASLGALIIIAEALR